MSVVKLEENLWKFLSNFARNLSNCERSDWSEYECSIASFILISCTFFIYIFLNLGNSMIFKIIFTDYFLIICLRCNMGYIQWLVCIILVVLLVGNFRTWGRELNLSAHMYDPTKATGTLKGKQKHKIRKVWLKYYNQCSYPHIKKYRFW